MNYQETMDYIESIQSYGIVPGLDSVRELCGRMGNPQGGLKFVHIAGTNGKGSTLAFVSTILQRAGYRVGRFVSPTIFEYRERIQVNGVNIIKKDLCEGVDIIKNICYEMTREGFEHPTPFEVETALAFWYFQKKKCDIVVLETGMGGLSDATNVVERTLAAVITPISMDHMQFLGDTLRQIARQKAGIIKEGCTVLSGLQEDDAMEVIRERAREKGCELRIADRQRLGHVKSSIRGDIERQQFDYIGADGVTIKGLEIRLAGRFQPENALLAIETVRALAAKGFSVREAALRKGLQETVWQGRFSVIARKPLLVVDGAHNEDAARKLAQSVEFYFADRKVIYIMGMLRDKEYEKVIALTHSYADHIITLTPPVPSRAMHAYELAQEVAKVHAQVSAVDSIEEAVEMARLMAGPEDVILAFGSLSYLGRLIKIVEGQKKW